MFFEKWYDRFAFPGDQNILNWVFCTLSTSHQNFMSVLLDFFGFTVLFIIPSAVLLSVLTGVPSGVFMRQSLIIVLIIGNYSCTFKYNPPHSASADDAITNFIALSYINIVPLKSLPYLLPK